jgi:amino acid transporter
MQPTPNEPPAARRLGVWDAITIIVGIVIGTTIFKLPWLIFMSVSDPWTGLGIWVVGGVLALFGALCYAELAATYPRSGGDYVYLSRAFGPWVGYLFGWGQLAVVLPASIGTMAVVFGEFAVKFPELKQFWEEKGLIPELMWAITAVAVIALLNIVGVVLGKLAQSLLTIAKVVGLGAILVAGFSYFSFDRLDPPQWDLSTGNLPRWEALAIILVLYAYGGWNDAAFVAAEVRNPQRNIPRALIIGVSAIAIIYVLINLAYLMGQGFEGARAPMQLNPERLLTQKWGEWGGKAISVIVMVSALGAVNGLTFAGSRVYATLGKDYRLFALLGHTTGLGSPLFALLLQALITVAFLLLLGTQQGHEAINQVLVSVQLVKEAPKWATDDAFEALVSHTAPVFWVFFLLTGLSLFALREKDRDKPRPFSVPFYPFVPFIFCLMCLYMIYKSTEYVGWRSLLGLGLLALGLPMLFISWLMGSRPGQDTSPAPEKAAAPPWQTPAPTHTDT